jgi:hypothetical protein
MQSFGIDKNYEEINFEEVSVEDLQMISGGSGGLTPMEGGVLILGLAAFPISAPLMAFSFALGMTLILGQAFA